MLLLRALLQLLQLLLLELVLQLLLLLLLLLKMRLMLYQLKGDLRQQNFWSCSKNSCSWNDDLKRTRAIGRQT
jgi:hypothetical protein